MKTGLLFLLLFVATGVFDSCKKSIDHENSLSGLSGRWNMIVDSFPSTIGPMHSRVIYNGTDSDYYDFGSDSILSVKEGSTQYAYHYHITPASTVTITVPDPYFDTASLNCSVLDLTAHSVTLYAPPSYSPGGFGGKTVCLKR